MKPKCHICGDDMPHFFGEIAAIFSVPGAKIVCGVCADYEGIKEGPIEDERLNQIFNLRGAWRFGAP